MAEFMPIQIGRNMLAGQQGAQQIQEGNQMMQARQQRMQQMKADQGREDQFRNELTSYLQGGPDALAGMMQADPYRAMQVQQMRAEQNRMAQEAEAAKRAKLGKDAYDGSSYILKSGSPKELFMLQLGNGAEQNNPFSQFARGWEQRNGKPISEIGEAELLGAMRNVQAVSGQAAGIAPDEKLELAREEFADKKATSSAELDIKKRELSIKERESRNGPKPKDAPVGYEWAPDGTLKFVPGGPADPVNKKSPSTDGEKTAANFLQRMEKAESLLDSGYTTNTKDYLAASRLMASEGGLSSALANKWISPEGQKYYQAAADWSRAKLRKESGASISPAEITSEVRTYFPVPGDSKDVIKQKRDARITATEGMRGMAGAAASPATQGSAPPAALAYLKANPNQKAAFKAKYGYLPDG